MIFFYRYLDVVDEDKLDAILGYISGVLGGDNDWLIKDLKGYGIFLLGKYFNSKDKISKFWDLFISKVLYEDLSEQDLTIKCIEDVFFGLDEENKDFIKDKLKEYPPEISSMLLECFEEEELPF